MPKLRQQHAVAQHQLAVLLCSLALIPRFLLLDERRGCGENPFAELLTEPRVDRHKAVARGAADERQRRAVHSRAQPSVRQRLSRRDVVGRGLARRGDGGGDHGLRLIEVRTVSGT